MVKKLTRKKSIFFINSIILLLFSTVFLAVSLLGTSLAWFSDTANFQYNGTTAQIVVSSYNNGTKFQSTNNIEITSATANPITVKSEIGSDINVYVRAIITCNWKVNSAMYGEVTDVVNINVSSDWFVPSGSNAIGDFIYYRGSVVPNTTKTLISSIGLTGSIPTGAQAAVVNIYTEAVQADDLGIGLFGLTSAQKTAWLATFPA